MPRIFITSGTSYTLPPDFNPGNNTIECYGCGSGGGGAAGSSGGGGGAYARSTNVNVAAGALISINVGVSANSNTWFNATSLANAVVKSPSLACGAQGASFATGGQASAGCGVVGYSGGNGGSGMGGSGSGGGGGGAGGPNGNGGNGANAGAGTSNAGGGGGGADGGQTTTGWNGGGNRFGVGGGAGGLNAQDGDVGTGGGGGGSLHAIGGHGSFEDVYGDGVHGPGGGGGGGGSGSGSGGGGYSLGYGGGGGGSGDGLVAGGVQTGLIVITYVSAPIGGASGVTSSFLPLRAPYFVSTRTLRPADIPPPAISWFKQPIDTMAKPPNRVLYQLNPPTTQTFPNPTPLYKPPWLQWPELLRRLPPSLDHRQQFPGKAPMDFFAKLSEGPDTVSTGATPIQVQSPINATLLEYDLVTSLVHPMPDLGGSDDIVRRVKLLLPKGWWHYRAPIRDAIIGGLADSAAWCYGLFSYAKLQSRVAWATDIWLDILSKDYFRFELPRRVNESDDIFRARIQEELIRERVTRAGMSKALEDLTGKPPYIFEPWNPGDAGAWDVGTFAWDIGACGWGDTCLPAQAFINVVPPGSGIPGAPGWDIASGWDTAATMWGDMDLVAGTITNADIYATINKTRPTGSIMWTQLFAPAAPIPIPPPPGLTPTFKPPAMNPLVVQPSPQLYSIAGTDLPSIGLL